MTILEDLKAGRLVVVPREPNDKMMLMGGFRFAGKVPNSEVFKEVRKGWDDMLSEASPDHTTALLSLVEGMERERDKARALLERCRTVLGNMARENEGAIFNRWPINHEPLRADARNLLPLIEKEIGCES